jgi:biopolymer transport protein ExbD
MFKKPNTVNNADGNESIDLKPFINFLVVLIPVLMLSAEFSQTAIQKINLPERGSGSENPPPSNQTITKPHKLDLTLIVADSSVTIGTSNGFLPTFYFKEFAKYTDKRNQNVSVIVDKNAKPEGAANQKELKLSDILLYALNENSEIDSCLYFKGEMLIDEQMNPLKNIRTNSFCFSINNPRMHLDIKDPSLYEISPISLYDRIRCTLLQIKERYQADSEDSDQIIIAADNKVVYDKIVQFIDVAKASGFEDVSIAKLRI